ncbi:ribosome hibernation-promoting factor, HPF/YfiA family [Ruania halotolerans]|uniref:ribosome hibernation-promoting factor, HPF/YfiA family n=1 Tax=Ruania halotolerans TaxID=2897773 RepID=UPI001E3CCCFB|nr:ribosome-associated translation inhibitor RaiA [Ruania halotolerans]UFU07591.1 ribosome-associated translation inhibitor RaiA [Ruania halotolerans]
MEIVVVSRHTEVSERFRRHVEEKLGKVPQFSPYAQRVDVEVSHENNPRLAEKSERVELTVRAKGPVVRAEAAASDRYGALDLATAKLLERLRRARDRRKDHHHSRKAAPPPVVPDLEPVESEVDTQDDGFTPQAPSEPGVAVEAQLGDSPVVIRQKVHETAPMTVDQALAEMELVGHPFFLFIDSETMQPCAVYNRRGWTYGVIRLNYEATEVAHAEATA